MIGKTLHSIIAALCIAAISATVTALYQHETKIIGLKREASELRVKVYRQQLRHFEYREQYIRAVIQMVGLRKNDSGVLSRVDQTRLEFYNNLLAQVTDAKRVHVEEEKHQDR